MKRLTLLIVLLGGCGGDDEGGADAAGAPDAAGPDGPPLVRTQYVSNTIIAPSTPQQAQDLGIDLDGDAQSMPDNALGMFLAALSAQGLDFQSRLDQEVF